MNVSDPQVLYMILIVPSLFGLTLIGEGINKIFHDETNGITSIVFGLLFIGLVVFAYFFFTNFMMANIGI